MSRILRVTVMIILCVVVVSCSQNNAKSEEEAKAEQEIQEIREKIQKIRELAVKIEQNPEADRANEWRDLHRKYFNELERLLAKSEVFTQEGEFPELETAIKRTEGQLHEIELYLVQLREKGEDEKKIEETKTRIEKKKKELTELKTLLEMRKKGEYSPSAYQREKGEVTAYVISATTMTITVRLKPSGRVMVLYVPSRHRVEGQVVPNTEMIEYVKKLKKDHLIWARYQEGEEKGTYILQEVKKLKDEK